MVLVAGHVLNKLLQASWYWHVWRERIVKVQQGEVSGCESGDGDFEIVPVASDEMRGCLQRDWAAYSKSDLRTGRVDTVKLGKPGKVMHLTVCCSLSNPRVEQPGNSERAQGRKVVQKCSHGTLSSLMYANAYVLRSGWRTAT